MKKTYSAPEMCKVTMNTVSIMAGSQQSIPFNGDSSSEGGTTPTIPTVADTRALFEDIE